MLRKTDKKVPTKALIFIIVTTLTAPRRSLKPSNSPSITCAPAPVGTEAPQKRRQHSLVIQKPPPPQKDPDMTHQRRPNNLRFAQPPSWFLEERGERERRTMATRTPSRRGSPCPGPSRSSSQTSRMSTRNVLNELGHRRLSPGPWMQLLSSQAAALHGNYHRLLQTRFNCTHLVAEEGAVIRLRHQQNTDSE